MKKTVADFVDDYLGEILAGNAAIFAGAGLSVPAGFVDWRELIRPLSKELGLEIDLEGDLVAVAQFHVNANGQNRHRLHKAVVEAIAADNPPTENHRLLARLPIATWWTTNYDKLIETALKEAGKNVDMKSAVPQLAITRPGRDAVLYKMHGDVDRPDEAVATRDDFERYPRDRAAFVTALAGDLVSKTFLFLGFSFTDPNLEHVLARIRYTFTTNQRRHYAVFRARTKLATETDEQFQHYRVRQELVFEDLKRYNVKVLVVDDYAEITEFLQELVDRYRRRTVLISGSIDDFGPWGEQAVLDFCQQLGAALIGNGSRVATGLGLGVGDAVFTGALREVMRIKDSIEDTLVLRPFPQSTSSEAERKQVWEAYRQELVSHAGVALFIFGNKLVDGSVEQADGVIREFEIAKEQGLIVLPLGATGSTALTLAKKALADPGSNLAGVDADSLRLLEELSAHEENLNQLVPKVVALVGKLQGNVAK